MTPCTIGSVSYVQYGVYYSPGKNVLDVSESPGFFSKQESGNPVCCIFPNYLSCSLSCIFIGVWSDHDSSNFICLCCARQLLSNGSLYVESRMAEEGMYQCQASASGVGVLLSRMAHATIACKFILCFVGCTVHGFR